MKIDRKELLAALEPLKAAIPSRTSIEALAHIWFDGDYAYAHDGGLGIRTKLSTPFKFGVPGNLFLGLVSQASGDSLSLEPSEAALSFKAGRSNVKLATLPLDRRVWPYPDEPEGKPVASLKASEAFLAALKGVFMVRPSNPQRMEHYAVSIYPFDETSMELYVTDSRTMVLAPVEEPLTGKIKALAVPRLFAEQLLTRCVGVQNVVMYVDHFRCIASDAVTLYSNVFDTADILDMPATADKFCTNKALASFVIPDGFRVALERAELVAGSEEPVVTLRVNGKKLELRGQFKFGELDEDFDLPKAPPKCSVNAITRLLLLHKGAERMMLQRDGITFWGKDDASVYMIASYEAPRSKKGASAAPEPDTSRAPLPRGHLNAAD